MRSKTLDKLEKMSLKDGDLLVLRMPRATPTKTIKSIVEQMHKTIGTLSQKIAFLVLPEDELLEHVPHDCAERILKAIIENRMIHPTSTPSKSGVRSEDIPH